jgi:hypothetical protein
MIQQALGDPANIGFVKGLLGLADLVVPGEDSRNKQLREIDLLLAGAPVAVRANRGADVPPAGAEDGVENRRRDAGATLAPSVPVDLLFDNHVVELEECRRWANSDAGQVARIENPAGFANVRVHAEAHLRAIGLAYAGQNSGPAPKAGGGPGAGAEESSAAS